MTQNDHKHEYPPQSGPGNAEAKNTPAAHNASNEPAPHAHAAQSGSAARSGHAAATTQTAQTSATNHADQSARTSRHETFPNTSAPRHIPVPRSLYPTFLALFIGVLIVSNITATKGVEIGPLVTDGAFFLFPLSYVIGDVLSECYGFKATRRAVWTGFAVLAFAMLCFFIAIHLPPAGFYENQDAFEAVLGTVPQLVLAGLAGYVVGQLLNAWSLNAIKKRTGERALWARLMGSTVAGEFVDTLIFCSIAATAIGIDSWGTFVNYVIVGFFWKTAVEFAIMPLTYGVIAWVKKSEGYYDNRTTTAS